MKTSKKSGFFAGLLLPHRHLLRLLRFLLYFNCIFNEIMPDNSLFLQEPNFKFVQMESTFSKYINVNGHLLDLSVPRVMGILNVTPDSFYAGSRQQTETDIATRARQILDEGACIIDIGAYSSRPDAQHISAAEEMSRLRTGLEIIRRNHPMPSSLLILSVPMWPRCVSPNTAWPLSMT
jgi:hypothetical protein